MLLYIYIPWALLQQTLLLFYLLGRLTLILRSGPPVGLAVVNGLAFGLVHVPDPWLIMVGWAGGTIWSAPYLRYHLLWPLVLSRVVPGTTFFYCVYAHDLAGSWMATSLPIHRARKKGRMSIFTLSTRARKRL